MIIIMTLVSKCCLYIFESLYRKINHLKKKAYMLNRSLVIKIHKKIHHRRTHTEVSLPSPDSPQS